MEIDLDEIQPLVPFKITEGYLGPQAKFEKYGLVAETHPSPFMVMDTNDIEIKFGFSAKTRFTHKLLSVDPKKEINTHCLAQCLGNTMCYRIVLPKTGFYKLQVYALPCTEAGPNFVGVFNYILCCNQLMRAPVAFPKQYPLWKEGCFLWEPLGLTPGIREPAVPFKMYIPRARDVQIKAHEEWTKLEQTEPDVYEGVVNFSAGCPSGAKVRLNVKFGGPKFDTILEYTI